MSMGFIGLERLWMWMASLGGIIFRLRSQWGLGQGDLPVILHSGWSDLHVFCINSFRGGVRASEKKFIGMDVEYSPAGGRQDHSGDGFGVSHPCTNAVRFVKGSPRILYVSCSEGRGASFGIAGTC